ncbi:solute carrier family 23 member 1-like isoform X2 [Mizuhopecten yessoensis]|uniref:solute carrier family 23 member 1-like isoform X2 n=1 Tax=Mizuhopecten yessoensis TaxID=6573 RepID=UPI000B458D54|nr:solute carrier family 23 member 1-like isoform X2 [Mizuhopecten yessoensis]
MEVNVSVVSEKCPSDPACMDQNGEADGGKENGAAPAHVVLSTEGMDMEESAQEHHPPMETLIYKIRDNPPMHLTILFAFQQALLSLANQLALSLMVAQAVCGDNSAWFKTQLLSSTLFMDGITTILMVLFGVRLPLFQGAAFEYVVPLLALQTLDPDRCHIVQVSEQTVFNEMTGQNATVLVNTTMDADQVILTNTQSLMGSLMVAGFIHFLIGATGLVGFLLRFVGPVTIVPTILLIGLYMTRTAVKFIEVHWGIGLMTTAISLLLSLYLGRFKLPIPVWTRKRSCHVIRYPLHQVFALLIGMMVGWAVSGVFTACGLFSDDPNDLQYKARTDINHDIVTNASWFYFPHPGQFGLPGFNVSVFAGFMLATVISILDSIGDYYACAKTCNAPPPPSHAINRGIAVEGLCTLISGVVGCGHATSTYGGNVGAIGITKVGSRQVFLLTGIIYIVFGLIGKFSAVFITIPYPVLGGALVVMFGMFIGVVLSNLQYVSLTSTRNIAIIGTSILFGLMVPYWVEQNPNGIDTGNPDTDRVLRVILGNANFAGAVLACFLDNTIPATKEERGITAWQNVVKHKAKEDPHQGKEEIYEESIDIYEPLLPKAWRKHYILKYIPFLPDPDEYNIVSDCACSSPTKCSCKDIKLETASL